MPSEGVFPTRYSLWAAASGYRSSMEVIINGKTITTSARNLAELIASQAIDTTGVAVALGTRVVPRKQWEFTSLYEGAVITLIRATQGG